MAVTAKCQRCGAGIAADTLICPYCGHRVNDEWKAEVRERRRKRRQKRNLTIAGGLAVIALLVIAAWPRDPGKLNDGTISASNSYIAQIARAGDVVHVTVGLPRTTKPADQLSVLADVAQDIGRAVAGGGNDAEGATSLVVEATSPTIDRKGDQSRYTVFRLKYDVAALRAGNYKGSPVGALNLAAKVQRVRPRADATLAAYCAANAVAAQAFCRTAARNEDDPAFKTPQAD